MILGEPGARAISQKIQDANFTIVGTPILVETGMVLSHRGRNPHNDLDRFLGAARTTVVNFTHEHARKSLEAFLRYGKGRHPAALNFGDCMSYAIARIAKVPLLFTGNDFPQTDIPAA
jgi:ribonuclease VapC